MSELRIRFLTGFGVESEMTAMTSVRSESEKKLGNLLYIWKIVCIFAKENRNGMNKELLKQKSYALMVMIGEIQNDIRRGENSVSEQEIDELYGLATEINEIIEEK